MPPLVSVVMPVFNAAPHLDQAIRSVLGQSFSNFEFVCVDNGSTDTSGEILKSWTVRDERIVTVTEPKVGIVNALNRGLAVAKGSFIARMDADDICRDDRFAKQVAYLESHLDCPAVGSTALLVDLDGSPIKRWMVPADHDGIMKLHLAGWPGQLIHPAVMMRQSALALAGGYRAEWQWVEDYDLFFRLSRVGPLHNLQEDLLYYRINPKGVTQSRRKQQAELTIALCNQVRREQGLPVLAEAGVPGENHNAVEDTWAYWIDWAWSARNYKTSQKYARRLLSSRKYDVRSWRLFLKAYLGRLSKPFIAVKRLLGA